MNDNSSSNDTIWKWWVFVLAGVLIATYSVWQAWDAQSLRALKGVVLGALCLIVGFWSKAQSKSAEE